MATVEFIHFCEYAFLNQRGHPCLIGIMGARGARAFPMPMAQLTVAVAIRIAAGDSANIRIEIGPEDGQPQRATNFLVDGPPKDGPLVDGLSFLPFQEVMLYFKKPHTVVARVLEDGKVLGTNALTLFVLPKGGTDRP